MQPCEIIYRNALPAAYVLQWYCIEHVLGQGAFGITYRAHDVNLNRSVAIKEYFPRLIATRDDAQTVSSVSDGVLDEFASGLTGFVNEAQTLAQFEHSNIVQVHNVFETNGTAYMVMPYEEGDTLGNILRLRGTLSEDEVLRLIIPLLSGLEAVHAAGFIHRDIKPANIFVRNDGSPILLDFGSARQALQSQPRELTNLVTGGYAPIEQYTGRGDKQGPWTDIYGLGATLYRAVTGHAPNDAVERGESLANDSTDTFTRGVERAAGRYQDAFLTAIDDALQFRICDRPQSVAEWRKQLVGGPSLEGHSGIGDHAAVEPDDAPGDDAIGETDAIETLEYSWTAQAERNKDLQIFPPLNRIRRFPSRGFAAGAAAILIATAVFVAVNDSQRATRAGADTSAAVSEISVFVPEADPGAVSPVVRETVDVAVAATEPPDVSAHDDEIAGLLAVAAIDVAALRLTTPAHENAYEKYRQVLAIDPGNPFALVGINDIADRYIALSYRSIEDGKLQRAEHYLKKAEEISSNSRGAAAIRETLLARTSEANAPAKAAVPGPATGAYAEQFKQLVVYDRAADSERLRADVFLRQIGGSNR